MASDRLDPKAVVVNLLFDVGDVGVWLPLKAVDAVGVVVASCSEVPVVLVHEDQDEHLPT